MPRTQYAAGAPLRRSPRSHVTAPPPPPSPVPYLGPLTAANERFDGLSLTKAKSLARRLIIGELLRHAPPRPNKQELPHARRHKERDPQLWNGIVPEEREHSGRWYQQCETCGGEIYHLITDPLDDALIKGPSLLADLYGIAEEIENYKG